MFLILPFFILLTIVPGVSKDMNSYNPRVWKQSAIQQQEKITAKEFAIDTKVFARSHSLCEKSGPCD